MPRRARCRAGRRGLSRSHIDLGGHDVDGIFNLLVVPIEFFDPALDDRARIDRARIDGAPGDNGPGPQARLSGR
jgi:hypothetical protein